METEDKIKRELVSIRPQLNKEIRIMKVPPNTPLYKKSVFLYYTRMANCMYENGYCN